jgi:uncharacterized membrane protein
MKKTTPLVAAVIGAALLAIQQFVGKPETNWKVIGLAVLIAVIGAASTVLKGKGASLVGVIGTVGYTFYEVWQTATFTWQQFIVTALFAVLTLFSHSFVPEADDSKP